MLYFNKQELQDKISACWIGKNIGGTIGGPYEGKKEILDVKGFTSAPGEPLPNDDLDLQLVWLRALCEQGPYNLNSKILGEYWMTFIGPSWNEYGRGKSNMADGFLPPMSGSVANEKWKHSNGAWIRTEIWACCFPGMINKVTQMAFEDACVDHGFGEGTYAAIFVAALEAVAFFNNNINDLLEIGLSKIPESSRVSRSVRLVMDCYEKGMDWKDARNAVVEDSADLGWFQAPANVAFVVLGLLYGKCDFKESMLYAVNCGDDTDCTAATVGALLGIMYGNAGIPDDWREYIGDTIKPICIRQSVHHAPSTCTKLTEMVMDILPITLGSQKLVYYHNTAKYNKNVVALTDGPSDFSTLDLNEFKGDAFAKSLGERSPYSITQETCFAQAILELDSEPVIAPMNELKGKITIKLDSNHPNQQHFHIKWHMPEGFSVQCRKNLAVTAHYEHYEGNVAEFTLTAGEFVDASNDILIELRCATRPTPIIFPLHIMG